MINASRFIEYGGILPLTLYNPLNRTIRQGSYTGVNNEFIWSYISGTVSDNNICSFDISAESWEGIFTLQIDKDTFIDLIQKNGIFFKFNLFELEYTNLTNIKFSVEHSYNKSSDDTVYYHQTSIDLWKEGEENKIACAYLPPSAFNGFFKEEDYVSTESIRIYVRAFGPNFTLSGKFNKPMLLIPNINLEYCFPYFASLSLEDKAKIIEKTVPYFYGYKTLGDTINLATPQFFSVTNLTELGDYSYRREEDQVGVNWSRIGWGGISGYNYARLNVSTNTSGLTFCFDDDKYIHFKIGQLGQMECMRFGMSSVSSATYLNEYGNYLYCAGDTSNKQNKNAPAGEFSIDYDSYMRVDISDSGWDFLFKISGFSDEDIYDWCRSFPSKENFPFTPHFNALELGKVGAKKTENDTVYTLGIAKLKLKNLVPSNAIYAHNTRKGPNTTIDYIDTLQYNVLNFYENGYRGRKIYIRCTYWANRNKEEGEVIGTFSFSPGNLIPVFDAPEISTTKNTVSKVYTIPIEPQTVTNRIGYYIGSTTYTTTSILKDIETYRDQTMIIDVNELEEAFPYFASLSDNEKKEILDTLPFFEDEFVLCGELRNLTPNPPYEWTDINGNLITITNQGESTLVSSTGIWNSISPGDLFPSNQRIFYKVTLSPTGDYTSYIFSVERQDSVGVSPSNQVRVLTSDSRETYSVLAKTINDNSKIILMNYADSGKESFILIDNDVFAINLTESGWYTFFKLLGASDQDIYNWADSLPYFADTYDVPISPLTITATADDYTARVSFGYIQDGQDGQDGANGEDAKLLLLTSDVSSFSLLPNGSASPNEATVTVNKQGITEDTEFIASNGMNIPDNSTEFKVTPYSAGLAKFKLKNIFNDSEDITIVSNATATIADGYSYEIAKDTNQMVFRIKIVNFEKAIEYLKNGIILQFIPKNIVKGTSDYFVACYVQYGYRDVTNTIKYHRPVSTQVLNFSDGKKITIYFSQDQIFGNLYPNDFNNLLNDVFTINFEMRSYSVPMTLDVVNIIFAVPYVKLEDAFPYFASLSDNEKKEILDTLPYFEDEFELCQTLENRSNPDKGIGSTYYYKKPDSLDYDPDTFTITFNYNNDPSITTPQYVFLGQDNITHYPEDSGAVFYDRCEIDFTSSSAVSETTQLNRIFGNEVWTHLSGNTLSEINVPIKQYENGFHKRSFLGLTRSTNGTPVFSYLKANQLPELDGSSLRLRNIVLINLTMLGWYVYFKLIGASDNEIYQWCENLPVFKDTYDVPISPLTITASAGDFSDSLSIGVIQDGMASFLGNNSFRPGGEVYSSELIEPEGAEAFKLISSAYYPPENVGLRMLPQGKLVSNQFVETETATGIQVVREPMEE